MTSENTIIDEHGWTQKAPIPASETVRLSLENCVSLCGLDKKQVEDILKGEFSDHETLNSSGISSKKIIIEYDIQRRDQSASQKT
tara:strand:+ start:413 stop:667 length:255 start_codon:yes stop_codon:yes gene_type:complete